MKRPLRPIARMAALGLFACLAAASYAHSGDFAGNVTDPATGLRCLTPACDTVVTSENRCVCRKENDAIKAADVRLTCTTGAAGGGQQCTPPRFGR